MKIEWNTVTWYSKLLAGILFGAVFILGLWLGTSYQASVDPVCVFSGY